MTNSREDMDLTPPTSGGKEEKKNAGQPSMRVVDDIDYDEAGPESKSSRTDAQRHELSILLKRVFVSTEDEKAAFTAMDTKTVAAIVKHVKDIVTDVGGVVPNAGVLALCFSLVSPAVDEPTRKDVYRLLTHEVAGQVRHHPTVFQNGLMRRLFCFVLRSSPRDKWTNACLHSINTFLADDKSPLAFALTYGSLLEVLSLLCTIKDSVPSKSQNTAVNKELLTQVEFAQALLEPLAPALLDPSYRPDGRFASGALCIKYQNATGWFPILPSQKLDDEIMQQVQDDVAFTTGLKLQVKATKKTSRKRWRAADFDAAVLATILPSAKRRRIGDKVDRDVPSTRYRVNAYVSACHAIGV